MIGLETEKTSIVDKVTGNVGGGYGKDSEDKASVIFVPALPEIENPSHIN